MLDLAYITLLDFLSRSPVSVRREECLQPRFVAFEGNGKDNREKASPAATDIACDRPEKSSRA